MAKVDKLLDRFFQIPSDFTWDEFILVLKHFGYEEIQIGKTSGSARKFKNQKGIKFSCHAPHKPNIVRKYVITNFINQIKGE